MMLMMTNGFVEFLPASLKIEVEFMQKVGTVGIFVAKYSQKYFKIFVQKYSQDICTEILSRYLYRNTLQIFVQKYSQDICAERYLYTNTFSYKLICAEICAQMGLGDFCPGVQRTQDGGGVYAKSRDKRDPPPARKYKNTIDKFY